MPFHFPKSMIFRSLKGAAWLSALVLTGALIGAPGFIANHAVQSRLRDLLATTKGLHIQSWHIAGGRVILKGLTVHKDGMRLAIGDISLPLSRQISGFWPIGQAQAASGAAKADNIHLTFTSLSSANIVLDIPHVSATGTSMSDADLAALFDIKSAVPIDKQLEKLNAASIDIADATLNYDNHTTKATLKMQNLALKDIVAGKAATASVASQTFVLQTQDAQEFTGKGGAISAQGLNLPVYARFNSQKRTTDNEPLQLAVDSISYGPYEFHGPQFDVTMQHMSQTQLWLRPMKNPDTSAITKAAQDQTKDHPLSPEFLGTLLNIYGDVFTSEYFGPAKATDIAFVIHPEAKTGDKTPPAPLHFSIGEFSIHEAAADPVHPLTAGIPSEFGYGIQHMKFDLSTLPKGLDTDTLHAMGYDNIDLSSNLDWVWNSAEKRMSLKEFSLSDPDKGSVAFGVTLGNVLPDMFSGNPTLIKTDAVALLVHEAHLNLVNNGLMEKIIARQAAQSNQTPTALSAQLAAAAATMIPAMLGNGPSARNLGDSVANFIKAPKNIEISVQSKDGLGVMDMPQLKNPAALMDKLAITTTVNK